MMWTEIELGPACIDDGMVTFTGGYIHPTHPKPEEISIEDIAGQLAHVNRYTGATRVPYSVGQHSLLVSRLLPLEYKLVGLLHDSPEAYLNDMAGPWKPQLTNYKTFENNLMDCIFQSLELPYTHEFPSLVKQADMLALAWEQREFVVENAHWPNMLSDGDWKRLSHAYGYLTPLPPQIVREEFMYRYKALREALEV